MLLHVASSFLLQIKKLWDKDRQNESNYKMDIWCQDSIMAMYSNLHINSQQHQNSKLLRRIIYIFNSKYDPSCYFYYCCL